MMTENTVRPEEAPVKCNYLNCAFGMEQAAMGTCIGDWNDPDCKKFISDDDFMKTLKKRFGKVS